MIMFMVSIAFVALPKFMVVSLPPRSAPGVGRTPLVSFSPINPRVSLSLSLLLLDDTLLFVASNRAFNASKDFGGFFGGLFFDFSPLLLLLLFPFFSTSSSPMKTSSFSTTIISSSSSSSKTSSSSTAASVDGVFPPRFDDRPPLFVVFITFLISSSFSFPPSTSFSKIIPEPPDC